MGQTLSRLLCTVFGYFYPAYASFKAVKSEDRSLHSFWLTYWIVSAAMSFVELFGDTLLSWLPFYYEAKVVFILWLTLPQFRGARVVFERFLKPAFVDYESVIDEGLDDLQRRGSEKLRELGGHAVRYARSKSGELLSLAAQLATEGRSGSGDGSGSGSSSSGGGASGKGGNGIKRRLAGDGLEGVPEGKAAEYGIGAEPEVSRDKDM